MRQTTLREKIFVINISDKIHINYIIYIWLYIYDSYNSKIRIKNSKIWAKDFNRYFTKKIYERPINTWIDAQNHYSSGKCKLKSTNPREWLKLKILTKVANLKTSW